MNRGLCVALIALHATDATAETGFTVAAGGGVNVDAPFVAAHVGRRFARAPFVELYLDYSYDRPISEFSFQTFGIGVRTYLALSPRFELFHQAMVGFVVSSSGRGAVQDRQIGERLLGPILTQGIGLEMAIDRCWTAALAVSTGTPVWLRPELSVKYTF